MTYDGLEHVSLLTYPEIRDRLILLDGWSKTYAMTGWRMGYSVWPAPLYDNVRKLAVNAWSCVNAAAQYAGLAALTGPQDSIAAMVAEFDKRRQIVVDGMNDAPRRHLRHAEGRLLRLPQHFGDRLQGQAARHGAARGSRRGSHRRPRFRHPRRGLPAPLLRQFGGEHRTRHRPHPRLPRPQYVRLTTPSARGRPACGSLRRSCRGRCRGCGRRSARRSGRSPR